MTLLSDPAIEHFPSRFLPDERVPRHRAPEDDGPVRVAGRKERQRPGRHAHPEDAVPAQDGGPSVDRAADADHADPLAWLGFRFRAG